MKRADLSVRLVTAEDKSAWDHLAGHPLQSWAWGEFRKAMGIDVVRLGVFEGKKLIEPWQLTFHKIPFIPALPGHLPFTIGYFPKGPIPSETMLEELKKIGRQKNAIFIQLEPNVPTHTTNYQLPTTNLIPSHHPLFTKYTFILDLTKSEDELLAAMHSKTRYNIKVAQKHGVEIKEDNSKEAFNQYLRLSEATTKRQGFYAHDRQYHQRMWESLAVGGTARLFTASYKKTILAAWILFVWNDTLYYPYGASSREHREVMAPNLLLWEIVLWAKKRGFKYFDLWGALGPNPDVHDPWYGFHRFKEGFRPKLVEFVGSYDLAINKSLYQLYKIADYIRWFLLKLKHS